MVEQVKSMASSLFVFDKTIFTGMRCGFPILCKCADSFYNWPIKDLPLSLYYFREMFEPTQCVYVHRQEHERHR